MKKIQEGEAILEALLGKEGLRELVKDIADRKKAIVSLEKERKGSMHEARTDIEALKWKFETSQKELLAQFLVVQSELQALLSRPKGYVTFIRFIRIEEIPGSYKKKAP